MSAYALPGLFFLPCPQSADQRNEKTKPAKFSLNTQKDATDSLTVTSSLSSDSVVSAEAVTDNLMIKRPSWYRRQKHNLYVTIKSASIDPTRLIHNFTTRKGSVTKMGPSRNSFRSSFQNEPSERNRESFLKMFSPRRSISASLRSSIDSSFSIGSQFYGAEGDLDEMNYDSPPSSPKKFEPNSVSIDHVIVDAEDPLLEPVATPIGRGSFYGVHPAIPAYHVTKKPAAADAVEFILSIDFNGRKYTAARTFPSFIKLREDIVRENFITHSAITSKNHSEEVYMVDDESLSSDDQDMDEVNRFFIPELPIGQGNLLEDMESGAVANVGLACRGFTRLQAIMTSYCPVMEQWLQSVTNMVPDSPSLHDFLWEPMSPDSQVMSILTVEANSSRNDPSDSNINCRSLKTSLRSSTSTLLSIEECFMDDDDAAIEMQRENM
jgi:hypothetical protein